MRKIIVNTWKTKGTPWTISCYPPVACDYLTSSLVSRLVALRNVPPKVPPHVESVLSTALPRFYEIVLDDDGSVLDVKGIRRDGSSTKWSLKSGYWHPVIIDVIIGVLRRENG